MASSNSKWTPQRKVKNAANYEKARRKEEDAKRNGHPGVSAKAHNGKTQGGYTPEKLAWRAAVRRTVELTSNRESA